MTNNANNETSKHSYTGIGIALGPALGLAFGQLFFNGNLGVGIGLGLALGVSIDALQGSLNHSRKRTFTLLGAFLGALLGLALGLLFLPAQLALTIVVPAVFGACLGLMADELNRVPVFTLLGFILGALAGAVLALLLGFLQGAHAVLVGYSHTFLFGLPFKPDYIALAILVAAITLGLGSRVDLRPLR